MISARTALHTAPWWCRPGSACTPTTQPPVADLAPMSWSGPRWSPPEMGLGGPVLVVFSCHPLCMPWLCSLSRSHQGCPRGGLTGTRRPGVGCVWCCDSGCAPVPQHVYLGLRGCVCVHTCVSLLKMQRCRLRRGCPQDVPRLRGKQACSSFLIWVSPRQFQPGVLSLTTRFRPHIFPTTLLSLTLLSLSILPP